jgi:hypothetical protein
MSKYSTEELIKTLKASNFSWIFKSEADAIIARLRAFDELRKASKEIIIWFDSRSNGFRKRCADEPWSTLRGLLCDFARREI